MNNTDKEQTFPIPPIQIGPVQTAAKNRRIGFPRLYSYCSDVNYYYLVMQLLGVNLKELKESFKECKFNMPTVIIIAL